MEMRDSEKLEFKYLVLLLICGVVTLFLAIRIDNCKRYDGLATNEYVQDKISAFFGIEKFYKTSIALLSAAKKDSNSYSHNGMFISGKGFADYWLDLGRERRGFSGAYIFTKPALMKQDFKNMSFFKWRDMAYAGVDYHNFLKRIKDIFPKLIIAAHCLLWILICLALYRCLKEKKNKLTLTVIFTVSSAHFLALIVLYVIWLEPFSNFYALGSNNIAYYSKTSPEILKSNLPSGAYNTQRTPESRFNREKYFFKGSKDFFNTEFVRYRLSPYSYLYYTTNIDDISASMNFVKTKPLGNNLWLLEYPEAIRISVFQNCFWICAILFELAVAVATVAASRKTKHKQATTDNPVKL